MKSSVYFVAGLGFEFTLLINYFPYLMDAGREDEILGSEIEDFFTHGTASSVGISMFASVALVLCHQQNSSVASEIPVSLHTHTF